MFIASAEQTRKIEASCFHSGMPVAALMEKAGLLLTQKIIELHSSKADKSVGILAGPGHNGGDAFVVGRELLLRGWNVIVWQAAEVPSKPLTAQHAHYFATCGGKIVSEITALETTETLIDGIFGFGLERTVTSPFDTAIDWANGSGKNLIAIDIPSGLHSDHGRPLGSAIRAQHTLSLGVLKTGLCQDAALEYCGELHLIDLGYPASLIREAIAPYPPIEILAPSVFIQKMPFNRRRDAHKYTMGTCIQVAGSKRYAGAAHLTGLGIRASGVGYHCAILPESLRSAFTTSIPEAVCFDAPASLPTLRANTSVVYGPGLDTNSTPLQPILQMQPKVLLIDASGLRPDLNETLCTQPLSTQIILTPHDGEFARLAPDLAQQITQGSTSRQEAASALAQRLSATIVLKGARTVIASPNQQVAVNVCSTPALARGGSGDLLAGLIGGLTAQDMPIFEACCAAVWLHSQAALWIEKKQSPLGVDPMKLSRMIPQAMSRLTTTI